MSKFFDRTAKTTERSSIPSGDNGVDHWLEEVQKTVESQLAGVTLSAAPVEEAEESADDAPHTISETQRIPTPRTAPQTPSAPAVGKRFRRVDLPAVIERVVSTSSADDDQAASEAYRVLRTRLMRRRALNGVSSVAITSSVKGEGKTLTSLNLALCSAQVHGMKVLLIDADLRTQGVTNLLAVPSSPGLADVLEGAATYESAILATSHTNLFVLPAGLAATHPPELFARPALRKLLDWCKEEFKLVLIDCPPITGLSDCELITAACDGAIIVARARRTRPDLLKEAMTHIDASKILGVVFNEGHSTRHPYYYSSYGSRSKDHKKA